MIADTSALVEHLRGRRHVKADATTTVTVYELLRLGHRKGKKVLSQVRALLSSLYVYGFDERAAEVAAEIDAALSSAGHPVNTLDVLIAATAVVNGEDIVTLDRDFEIIDRVYGLPGLVLL